MLVGVCVCVCDLATFAGTTEIWDGRCVCLYVCWVYSSVFLVSVVAVHSPFLASAFCSYVSRKVFLIIQRSHLFTCGCTLLIPRSALSNVVKRGLKRAITCRL